MFESTSPYAYANNPGTAFLDQSLQQTAGFNTLGQSSGLVGQQFGQVMDQMSAGLTRNAQQGINPMFQGPQYNVQAAQAQRLGVQTFGGLTAAQLATQMQVGGPASVLPYMGNSFLPKLVFPIAGLWSMYGGMKAMGAMRNEARTNVTARFNPSQLNYNNSLDEFYQTNDRWAHLGPLH